jgi:hypothetical protein
MIQFPVVPRGTVVTPQLIRTSGDLVSTLGGPTQRITRIGSRYAATVELPSLDAACAGRWLACPLQAEAMGDTLALVMPQMIDVSHMVPNLGTGAAGSSRVTFTATTPSVGMWFSFLANGRHYLHLITGADAATKTATVSPLLRAPMANTPMDFIHPILEGFADDTSWSLEYFRFVGHKFTLTESA